MMMPLHAELSHKSSTNHTTSKTAMRFPFITSLLSAAIAATSLCAAPDGDISDLKPINDWKKLANGVYVASLGETDKLYRYSDLAGAPPKLKALNSLPDVPLTKALENARYRINPDHKIMVYIPTEPDEKIYGYGLQFDKTMRSGKVIELKVDHYSKDGGSTHAPVPFFISSKGYGVFFNTAAYLKIYNQVCNRKDSLSLPKEVDRNPPADEKQAGPWLAVPPSDAVEAYIQGDGIELVGFTGTNLQDIVARYNLYSGGGAMPPLWGLGFWHRTPAKFSAAETEQEIADFKDHNMPLDVIGLEPGWQSKSYPCTFEWQKKRFPDPAAFTQKLLDDGIRLNLWVNPYISKHARIYEDMYPLSGSHTVWLGIAPDYMLPEARKVLLDQHKTDHFDIGISGYKIDECDGYDFWLWPDHATFPSGTPAEVMRQTYGMQLQRMIYKELYQKNNRRTYSKVRASNGAASNYPFVIYSDSYGHDQYVTGISAASLSGILWCPEIRSAKNSREWINRMHTTCLSPMAMLNAWASETKPWTYEDSTDAIRRTIQLRMQLLPYLYTAFARYNQEGIPPVRSMLLETGEAEAQTKSQTRKLDSEEDPYGDGFHQKITEDNTLYMFGPDILVAPFINTQIERKVNLPTGNWYNFYTGKLAGNGTTIIVTAEQTNDMPPLFVKEGSLIPMLKDPVNRTRDMQGAAIEIRHYGTKVRPCQLYEDDTTSFSYLEGAYNLYEFSVKDGELTQEKLQQDVEPFYSGYELRKMTEDDAE
jgi:alpha-glucosidase (family GH31 glycosyl hydrolase)